MLKDFLEQFEKIPAEHKLVATAPLQSDYAGTRDGKWLAAFREDMQQLTSELALPFEDWTLALPSDGFITSNHFHSRNHERMAALLEQFIATHTAP